MISGSPGFPIQSPVQKSGILSWQRFKQIFQVDFTHKKRKEKKTKILSQDLGRGYIQKTCSERTNHGSIDGLPEGNVNTSR